MKKRYVIISGVGVALYFVVVYFSVNISITGLQDQYSIGDTIDFTVDVSGIGSTAYVFSVEFEKMDGSGNIMGLHQTGLGPTYLDPPFYFSEQLEYSKTIDSDVKPGKYLAKIRVLKHTIEKIIEIVP